MSKPVIKSINIKVSEEQKDKLDDLAIKQGATLKEVILNGTIYSDKEALQEELSNLNKQLASLRDIEQRYEALNSEISSLNKDIDGLRDLLEAKEDNLTDVRNQLEQANRALNQQQQLQLSTQLKLESLEQKEEQEQRKGFFSRLFSRD